MDHNVLPSDRIALLDVINPASQAPGAVAGAWLPMSNNDSILFVIKTGVLGALATIDAKLQQANTAAGGGAKDITGKAITQLTKAANDDDQVMINVRSDELDADGGFAWVQLQITVGAAASIIDAVALGFDGRYQPVDHVASMVEAVN